MEEGEIPTPNFSNIRVTLSLWFLEERGASSYFFETHEIKDILLHGRTSGSTISRSATAALNHCKNNLFILKLHFLNSSNVTKHFFRRKDHLHSHRTILYSFIQSFDLNRAFWPWPIQLCSCNMYLGDWQFKSMTLPIRGNSKANCMCKQTQRIYSDQAKTIVLVSWSNILLS